MKILLLSAYDAGSHQYWRRGLCQTLSEHQWTVLTLPARYFSWRIRGNSLTWSGSESEVLRAEYDLLLATSMVDLATLRGLVPELSRLPAILYFHENQFAYPPSERQFASVEPQMVSLYASLCASSLVFNSNYNRQSFLTGVQALLRKLPDGVPPGIVEQLKQKSSVLPVPLNAVVAPSTRADEQRLNIVWNHRWEYDKGPDLLLAALEALDPNLPVTVHVLGQRFRRVPEVFDRIYGVLQRRGWLGQWGYVKDEGEYLDLLGRSHLVVSTAYHDFQGLAVLEAVMQGCIPLVPAALAYPEFLPEQFCYRRLDQADYSDLCRALTDYCELWLANSLPQAPDLHRLTWQHLGPVYRQLLTTSLSP